MARQIINVNPTLVNVLTDLVLLMLVVVWQQAMSIMTVVDVRNTLRKGTRLISLERLGSLDHFHFGVSKYKALVAWGVLKGGERRNFQWKVTRGLGTFLIGAVLVLLHVVIDSGLDFKQEPLEIPPNPSTDTYSMVKLSPNHGYEKMIEVFNQLQNKEEDWREENCEHPASNECKADSRLMDGFANEFLRESMVFGRTMYGAASLAQADMIDAMEIEFTAMGRSGPNGTLRPREDCKVLNFTDELDFAEIQLAPNDEAASEACLVGPTMVRSVTVDMRSRQLVHRNPRPIRPELAKFAEFYDILAYESFKDDRQLPSTYNLSTTEMNEAKGIASLTVDNKVQYFEAESGQQVRVIQLTSKTGDVPETDVGFDLWTVDLEIGEYPECVTTQPPQRSFDGMMLSGNGKTCGPYDLMRMTERCLGMNVTVRGEETYITGQMTRGGVMLYDAKKPGPKELGPDDCLRPAIEKYSELFDDAVPTTHRAMMMGTAFEVICAQNTTHLKCAGGQEHVRWTGEEWVEETEGEEDEANGIFRLAVETAWIGIEIHGGEADEIAAVFEIMRLTLEEQPTYLRWFSSDETTRIRIPGGDLHWAMATTMSALSPHVAQADRTVLLADQREVSVLTGAYIGGMLSVIGTVAIAALLSVIATVVDAVAYSRGKLPSVRVPQSITSWVSVVMQQLDPSYSGTNMLLHPPGADGQPSTVSSESWGPRTGGAVGADSAGA